MEIVIKAISKRQWRFLQAILNGTARWHPRGNPPPYIAAKYSEPDPDAPEQSGVNRGGIWTVDGKPGGSAKLRKAFNADLPAFDLQLLDNRSMSKPSKRGAGVVVINNDNCVLLGRRSDDLKWVNPGGHVEENESFVEGALRELTEETGLTGRDPIELSGRTFGDYDTKTYLVREVSGNLVGNGELTELTYFPIKDLPWNNMRDYSIASIRDWANSSLKKSKKLKDMKTLEILEKNFIGSSGPMVQDDSLRLVSSGAYKFLQDVVTGMQDEDFKDVPFDSFIIHIRKHMNDLFSGRITDGQKTIHQFTSSTLSAVTADLMSVFEWYSPEDEGILDTIANDLSPDAFIKDGLETLSDEYKKHNIANIYTEMENIRKEIRNGVAVDLQQVEARITQLFDKLEDHVNKIVGKHNELTVAAGNEIDELEAKIRDLQTKVEALSKIPSTVEAIQTKDINPGPILDQDYCYLSKPRIEILPNGKIHIFFADDWQDIEKENLLHDLRAKMVKKVKKDD